MSKRLIPEAFHPGEYILEEMAERKWSMHELAHKLKCSFTQLHGIVYKKQTILPEMAMALGDVFGTGAQVWLNLQATYWLTVFEMRRRKNEQAENQA